MTLDVEVLSGGPAGSTFRFGPDPVAIGRGPEAGLRFDPERDLTVSARHALLYADDGRWWIRDLDSRNGTYLNGRRITAAAALSNGDRIAFGGGGPEVRVNLPDAPSGTAAADESDPARVIWIATAIVAVLLAVIAFLLIASERQQAAWDFERAALVARLDSMLAVGDETVRALEGEREGLADALRSAQNDLRTTRAGLDRAIETGDAVRIDSLRRELQARTVELERQQLAASLDFDAIERANRRAIALVYVEDDAGTVSTGTAFAVRPDAVLITARHVLTGGDNDRRPRRIAIQFSDSDQVFPAQLVTSAGAADVAVLRASNIIGSVPTIAGFNERTDTLRTGVPVAYIGFPLGGAPESFSGSARVARPIIASGIVASWSRDRIQIQGRGAAGASGSPTFDSNGRTVGLLFGGFRNETGEVVYGVPAGVIAEVLRTVR